MGTQKWEFIQYSLALIREVARYGEGIFNYVHGCNVDIREKKGMII